MVVEEKVEFFNMLVKLGFKEIEVGFPAASQIEYDFLRQLVERHMIPDDVRVQVLVQCREHLIRRTFEAIQGIRNVVVHIYNSTSTLQRDVVFHKGKEEITQIAVEGARLVKKYAEKFDGNIMLEYSPESFTGTELDYALEICTAVQDEWGATPENPIIINLPSTVEMTTPNVYADQIEWMNTHFKNRDSIILSVHPHNDRGTGVAATELAMLAGAERVEGTLFGNGERTGNVDILTLAYNMFSRASIRSWRLRMCGRLRKYTSAAPRWRFRSGTPMRASWSSPLFPFPSGCHQQGHAGAAGKKRPVLGSSLPAHRSGGHWKTVRAHRTDQQPVRQGRRSLCYGYLLRLQAAKGMHKEFADVIQAISEKQGEVAPEQIMEEFRSNYTERKEPIHFRKCQIHDTETEDGTFATLVHVTYTNHGIEKTFEGVGNGPIDAMQKGLEKELGIEIRVLDYNEHALTSGSGAQAASYIHLMDVKTAA